MLFRGPRRAPDRAQSLSEYALIIAAVVIAAVLVLSLFGDGVSSVIEQASLSFGDASDTGQTADCEQVSAPADYFAQPSSGVGPGGEKICIVSAGVVVESADEAWILAEVAVVNVPAGAQIGSGLGYGPFSTVVDGTTSYTLLREDAAWTCDDLAYGGYHRVWIENGSELPLTWDMAWVPPADCSGF